MERLWDVPKVIEPRAQATGRGGDQTCRNPREGLFSS